MRLVTPAHNTGWGEPCSNSTVKCEKYLVKNILSLVNAVKSGARRRPDVLRAIPYAGTAMRKARCMSRVEWRECPRHSLAIRHFRPSLAMSYRHTTDSDHTLRTSGIHRVLNVYGVADPDQHGRLRLGVHWPFGQCIKIPSQFQPPALFSRHQLQRTSVSDVNRFRRQCPDDEDGDLSN